MSIIVLWCIVSVIGGAYAYLELREARQDAQLTENLRNGRRMWAKYALHTAVIMVLIFALLILVGFTALGYNVVPLLVPYEEAFRVFVARPAIVGVCMLLLVLTFEQRRIRTQAMKRKVENPARDLEEIVRDNEATTREIRKRVTELHEKLIKEREDDRD